MVKQTKKNNFDSKQNYKSTIKWNSSFLVCRSRPNNWYSVSVQMQRDQGFYYYFFPTLCSRDFTHLPASSSWKANQTVVWLSAPHRAGNLFPLCESGIGRMLMDVKPGTWVPVLRSAFAFPQSQLWDDILSWHEGDDHVSCHCWCGSYLYQ